MEVEILSEPDDTGKQDFYVEWQCKHNQVVKKQTRHEDLNKFIDRAKLDGYEINLLE